MYTFKKSNFLNRPIVCSSYFFFFFFWILLKKYEIGNHLEEILKIRLTFINASSLIGFNIFYDWAYSRAQCRTISFDFSQIRIKFIINLVRMKIKKNFCVKWKNMSCQRVIFELNARTIQSSFYWPIRKFMNIMLYILLVKIKSYYVAEQVWTKKIFNIIVLFSFNASAVCDQFIIF